MRRSAANTSEKGSAMPMIPTSKISKKCCGCHVVAGTDQGGCTTNQKRLATKVP